MSKPSSKLSEHRVVLVTALFTQLAVTLAGMAVIYSCTSGSAYVKNPLSNAVFWGIIAPPGLMFVWAHVTVMVVGFLSVLFFLGLRWRKVRFLWFIGILLWGAWWVLLTYIPCTGD
ncbi:MAG TPA: hypothetical protein VJ875_04850 [Pyrinomonadaceae bacterium]|nr:hypothetical protein [Pyrinomonadaceae bacterium]